MIRINQQFHSKKSMTRESVSILNSYRFHVISSFWWRALQGVGNHDFDQYLILCLYNILSLSFPILVQLEPFTWVSFDSLLADLL